VETQAVLAYTALGHDSRFGNSQLFKSTPEHRELHVKWQKRLTELLRQNYLKVSGEANSISYEVPDSANAF
jgi:hypothetical protein